ncbi:hypothetical protein BGW36DRAFT_364655 [Talaromyces proteolyticus]|uniref:Uncharacterized protein n=1 Tax=Talaromyces proteolyticus TaxID=1131652 RepID=A0AAD4KFG7_9EURO|nr:uncharacterized protein BGW36DRAFT_364655 [Talaromyces proteolyticus]KAH8689918.1 hypothetical protein BGW36DRAFT_364655 [Talaromyces proteolyticus]
MQHTPRQIIPKGPIDNTQQEAMDIKCGKTIREFSSRSLTAIETYTGIASITPAPNYTHMCWLIGSIKNQKALLKEPYKPSSQGDYPKSYQPSSCISSDNGTVLEKSALRQWGKLFVEGGT